MQCPSCGSTLRTIDYEGIRVETCDGCGGEFLDAHEQKHIIEARQKRFGEKEKEALASIEPAHGVPTEEKHRLVSCAKCGVGMRPLNYGGDTGIIIDRCPECNSVWMDAAELEAIQAMVEGLEEQLPEDLQRWSSKLNRVAQNVDDRTDVQVARMFPFMNGVINGVIDLWGSRAW